MQNCSSSLRKRFRAKPQSLLHTWMVFVRLWTPPRHVCEVVHVDRKAATLVQLRLGRGDFESASPSTAQSTTPIPDFSQSFEVPLSVLLDPFCGFSYLGPRRDFEWIVPGAIIEEKDDEYGSYASIDDVSGTDVSLRLVPADYADTAAVAAYPMMTHSDLSIWDVSSGYSRVRDQEEAHREW